MPYVGPPSIRGRCDVYSIYARTFTNTSSFSLIFFSLLPSRKRWRFTRKPLNPEIAKFLEEMAGLLKDRVHPFSRHPAIHIRGMISLALFMKIDIPKSVMKGVKSGEIDLLFPIEREETFDGIRFFQPLTYEASDLIEVLKCIESKEYRPSIEHLIHGSYEDIDANVMVFFIKKQFGCCSDCLFPFIDVAVINSLIESNVHKMYYQLRQALIELIGLHLIKGFGENNNTVSVRVSHPITWYDLEKKRTFIADETLESDMASLFPLLYQNYDNIKHTKGLDPTEVSFDDVHKILPNSKHVSDG